jgi:transketolase
MMAAKKLKEEHGVSVQLIDMHTIKPLDTEAILRAARETCTVVTVEEHSINGGLGSAVAECLLENGFGGRFKRIGLPDEFAVLGETDAVYHYYGLDPEGIANTVFDLLTK